MGFGEHQVGLRGLLGWIYGFWSFLSFFRNDPVLVWGVFDVFWGLHWVSLGFPWSSCWKSVNCGFWRNSGRLRGTLGVDSWYLGFSSVFWVDPVLFGTLYFVFCGLRWV